MRRITPHVARERILVYGNAGCGKSKGALDLVRGTTGKVHVIDTDRAWDRMIEGLEEVDRARVVVADVRGDAFRLDKHPWPVLAEAVVKAARAMGKDDWLVVDMATIVWAWAQGYFSEQVFGKDIDDYFVDARRRQVEAGKKGGNPFDGMMDWPAISRIYDRFNDAVLNAVGHVYLTAECSPLLGDVAVEVDNLYARLGGKPKGNKTLDHVAQTVLKFDQNIKGEWVMSTAKDRERDRVERKVWGDFAGDYLGAIGGWVNPAALKARGGAQA